MSLADLDRKPVTWHYDRWDADVIFRPIGAKTYALLAGEFAGVHGQGVEAATPESLRFYAALLAATVESHPHTAEEWMEATTDTLQALGMEALRVNGLLVEEAKKN